MGDRDILQGVGARKDTRFISVVPFHHCHTPPWCTHRMGTPFIGQLKTTEIRFQGEDKFICVCVCGGLA